MELTEKELADKISELGAQQPWNHNFCLAEGIETQPGKQTSHGKNLVKWQRVKPLLTTISVSGRRILDVGCNEGFFSLELAKMGAEVLGIDADDQRIRKAEFVRDALGIKGAEFQVVDLYSPQLTQLHLSDICLCMGLLHRIPDPFAAIARLVEKANLILFEWKALKFGPHDEPFAYYTPGEFNKADFYGTQYWVMSFACVEAMLLRLGFDRFHRVDDPTFRRGLLVAGCVDNPIFHQPDQVLHRGRTRALLSHTKRYLITVGKIVTGRLNA